MSPTEPHVDLALPVEELLGRSVWTEAGERLGTVHDVRTDDAGDIVGFDVRQRWFLGKHLDVAANDMRLDSGDIIVPARNAAPGATEAAAPVPAAVPDATGAAAHSHESSVAAPAAVTAANPVLLAGRHGARDAYGGLDLRASLGGALVAFALVVIVGGLLDALFDVQDFAVDAGASSVSDVTGAGVLVGAATMLIAFLGGGWAAGRMARYDGVSNGLLVVAWSLVLGFGSALLGNVAGEEWDVYGRANVPHLLLSDPSFWGLVACFVVLSLMVFGAAVGGAFGERWHRDVDRTMVQVVSGAADEPGPVGSPVAPQPLVDPDDPDAPPHQPVPRATPPVAGAGRRYPTPMEQIEHKRRERGDR